MLTVPDPLAGFVAVADVLRDCLPFCMLPTVPVGPEDFLVGFEFLPARGPAGGAGDSFAPPAGATTTAGSGTERLVVAGVSSSAHLEVCVVLFDGGSLAATGASVCFAVGSGTVVAAGAGVGVISWAAGDSAAADCPAVSFTSGLAGAEYHPSSSFCGEGASAGLGALTTRDGVAERELPRPAKCGDGV